MTGALAGDGNLVIDSLAGASIFNNLDAINQGVFHGELKDGVTYSVRVKPVRNGLEFSVIE